MNQSEIGNLKNEILESRNIKDLKKIIRARELPSYIG